MIKFLEYLTFTKEMLSEMTSTHLAGLHGLLNKLLRRYNLNIVITTHASQQLSMNSDVARTGISAADVYESMVKFCEKQQSAFQKYDKKKKEYIGIITNPETSLNIVVSIDYHDARIKDYQPHNLKIITAMLKDNFGSDDYPDSIRVNV